MKKCNYDFTWGNQLSMTVMVFVVKVMIHKSDMYDDNKYIKMVWVVPVMRQKSTIIKLMRVWLYSCEQKVIMILP